MAALTLRTLTRAGDVTKGAPLTNAELDTNFINIDGDLDNKANLASPNFTGDVVVNSTTAIRVPIGATGQRPTGVPGLIRYNNTTGSFEGHTASTWGPIGGGGGATGGTGNAVFWENDITITVNYTITTGKNAGTFGPISIADGVTVTVPSGSSWTVV